MKQSLLSLMIYWGIFHSLLFARFGRRDDWGQFVDHIPWRWRKAGSRGRKAGGTIVSWTNLTAHKWSEARQPSSWLLLSTLLKEICLKQPKPNHSTQLLFFIRETRGLFGVTANHGLKIKQSGPLKNALYKKFEQLWLVNFQTMVGKPSFAVTPNSFYSSVTQKSLFYLNPFLSLRGKNL